ncbi:MAG: HNH endonuclease [Promethearchaeota archaeon]
MILEKCFTVESQIYKEFMNISFYPMVAPVAPQLRYQAWKNGMDRLKAFLEVTIERLELDKDEQDLSVDGKKEDSSLGTLTNLENSLIHKIYEEIIANPNQYHKESRSITPQRKKAVKLRDNLICQICNEIFEEAELEIDHILPYAAGGSNEEYNLMALCQECNGNKTNKLDYYRRDEGKFKLMENIKSFVKTLPMIHDFGNWLVKMGDKRRRKNT